MLNALKGAALQPSSFLALAELLMIVSDCPMNAKLYTDHTFWTIATEQISRCLLIIIIMALFEGKYHCDIAAIQITQRTSSPWMMLSYASEEVVVQAVR